MCDENEEVPVGANGCTNDGNQDGHVRSELIHHNKVFKGGPSQSMRSNKSE
jgi:hypothetical protein